MVASHEQWRGPRYISSMLDWERSHEEHDD